VRGKSKWISWGLFSFCANPTDFSLISGSILPPSGNKKRRTGKESAVKERRRENSSTRLRGQEEADVKGNSTSCSSCLGGDREGEGRQDKKMKEASLVGLALGVSSLPVDHHYHHHHHYYYHYLPNPELARGEVIQGQ